MVDKYLSINASGDKQEVAATAASTGVSEAGKIVALDTNGKISDTMMPTGVSAEVKVLPTSENLGALDMVNVYDNSSTSTARKADKSNGRACNGYVVSAVTSPANANVYTDGIIPGLSGMTPGATQYLDDAGGITETPTTTTGEILQRVGVALSATELLFEPGEPITRA